MARKKSLHQTRKERVEKKIALKLYKKGYSTRVVSQKLAERGIVRSKMWVWRLITEKGRDY